MQYKDQIEIKTVTYMQRPESAYFP